jgi:cell division protein FtsB
VRALLVALTLLLVAIQWPLWFGKGGWLRVWELQRAVEAQRQTNAALAARNGDLAAEVASLREGREAIEERARDQLNMIRPDELFFQWLPAPGAAPAAAEAAPREAAAPR